MDLLRAREQERERERETTRQKRISPPGQRFCDDRKRGQICKGKRKNHVVHIDVNETNAKIKPYLRCHFQIHNHRLPPRSRVPVAFESFSSVVLIPIRILRACKKKREKKKGCARVTIRARALPLANGENRARAQKRVAWVNVNRSRCAYLAVRCHFLYMYARSCVFVWKRETQKC